MEGMSARTLIPRKQDGWQRCGCPEPRASSVPPAGKDQSSPFTQENQLPAGRPRASGGLGELPRELTFLPGDGGIAG